MSYKDLLSTPGLKAVLFTLFMTSFGFGVIIPLLPFYSLSLGAKPFELGMLTATFAFLSFLFGPVMGKMADRFGRRKVLLVSTAGFIVPYVIFAYSEHFPTLFIARALEGIFAAGIFPSCISLLSDYTSEEQRGKAMGVVGMTFSLGFIFGPAFGGIVSHFSVRATFLLSALLSGINFVFVFLQVREPQEKRESKDLAVKEVGLLQHLSSPLLFLFLSTFMTAFMIGGIDATLALYTGERLGFSSGEVGLVFTYVGFLIMGMQFVAGQLINTYGELKLIPLGFLLSGVGFFLLTYTTSWALLLFPLAIFVAGNALVFPSVNSLITKKVRARRGVVLGLVNSFQSLGQIAGPLLGGFLYGISHTLPFFVMAVLIWAFMGLFLLVGAGWVSRFQ